MHKKINFDNFLKFMDKFTHVLKLSSFHFKMLK